MCRSLTKCTTDATSLRPKLEIRNQTLSFECPQVHILAQAHSKSVITYGFFDRSTRANQFSLEHVRIADASVPMPKNCVYPYTIGLFGHVPMKSTLST